MLPIIAELFETTIDNLMGYAKECTTAEREAFFAKVRTLDKAKKITCYREMLQQYPNDTILQFGLANLLYGLVKKKMTPDGSRVLAEDIFLGIRGAEKICIVGANVLILDEPTRNFSPLSGPIIRKMLREFPGAVISISHDRKYMDEVCEKKYILDCEGLHLQD